MDRKLVRPLFHPLLFRLDYVWRLYDLAVPCVLFDSNLAVPFYRFNRSLTNTCLTGSLPSRIFLLTNLKVLEVSSTPNCRDDPMTGSFPNVWHLNSLERLVLGVPGLSGSLNSNPMNGMAHFRVLKHLEIFNPLSNDLDIGGNLIVEPFMEHLVVLRLEHTLCRNLLPLGIDFSMPSLLELSFAYSSEFSDNVTRIVIGAPNLEHLNLAKTNAIFNPNALLLGRALQSLALDQVKTISTSVNDWLWDLPSLVTVSIENTPVYGTIAPTIGNLANLTKLVLSRTRITGTIPTQIGNCTKLETLFLDSTSLSHPLPNTLGDLSSLRELTVSMMTKIPQGTIPESLSKLTQLNTLTLSSCSLIGTIPPDFSKLTNLKSLYLNDNSLRGSIPDLPAKDKWIDFHNNFLSGTIPRSVATSSIYLKLSHNELGPELGPDFFSQGVNFWLNFDISHNKFRAPLPQFAMTLVGFTSTLYMSYNQFYGEIPGSYALAQKLFLDHNNLTGSLDPLFSHSGYHLAKLYVGYNQLEGDLSNIRKFNVLQELSIPGNRFRRLPPLSSSLRMLDCGNNLFGEGVVESNWYTTANTALKYLDLSGNRFGGNVDFSTLIASNITYLSLADNDLYGFLTAPPFDSSMEDLDLSNNRFSGEFYDARYPNLVSLKIANNSFSGDFRLANVPRLAELDISNNAFQFEVSSISQHSFLISIRAQNNPLFGSLVLDGMRNLQLADFSNTSLTYQPNLYSIGLLFSEFALESLNIMNNRGISPSMVLGDYEKILKKTNISSPSTDFPSSVVCHTLAFSGRANHAFLFDENLFFYAQCVCDSVHFGMPPHDCYPCPSSGTDMCGGTQLHVKKEHYAITVREGPLQEIVRLETEPCKTLPSLKEASSPDLGSSACKGLELDAKDGGVLTLATQSQINAVQCAKGSTGRLCSNCTCDTRNETGNSECYYPYGEGCRRCSKVLKLSQSLPILFCALIVLYGAGTAVMLLVLRGRRNVSLEQWHQLSLLKRMFYRLIYLTSLGNITILVTFVQMLLEFTHWDTYMSSVVMLVMNARGDGVGIRCMFPFLADPLAGQIVQLSVPWAFVTLVGACVSSAALISHIMERRAAVGRVESSSLLDGFEDIGSPLLTRGPPRALVTYPAAALFASVSISVIKFFYFGTALSAHEYLFSSTQAFTGDKYVQNLAWLRYGDAYSVIMASIPTMLIFDFVLPISFVYVSWRVRKTFETPSVQMYFGTLFETFDRRCFWWEMVNILRKLTIALALRGISSSNLVQGSVVTSVLMGTLLIQLTVRPWKRKIENFADSASTLILIGALSTSRLEYAPNYEEVNYYVLALSVVFVIGSVVAIAFQTFFGIPSYVKQRQHLKSEGLSVQAADEDDYDNSETEGDFVGLSRDSQQLSRKVALSHQNTSDQALLTD